MEMKEDPLQQLINLQKETLRWIRFQSLPSLKMTLEKILNTDKKKQIYELTDGKNSSRVIETIVKVDHTTVVDYWNEWTVQGILEKEGAGGRSTTFHKIISLPSIGIPVVLPTIGNATNPAAQDVKANINGDTNGTTGTQ
jgi:hypothetical protein